MASDVFIRDMTHPYVTWLVHASVRCDIFTCDVTSCTCDMTHSRVTWLICMYHTIQMQEQTPVTQVVSEYVILYMNVTSNWVMSHVCCTMTIQMQEQTSDHAPLCSGHCKCPVRVLDGRYKCSKVISSVIACSKIGTFENCDVQHARAAIFVRGLNCR